MFRSEKIHLDSKNLVTEKLVTKPGDGNVIALTRNKRVNGNTPALPTPSSWRLRSITRTTINGMHFSFSTFFMFQG